MRARAQSNRLAGSLVSRVQARRLQIERSDAVGKPIG